jgi:DNA (cytosine-5)-methyltransferase 1
MLKLLDLFSGIGGFSLGMEATNRIKTIAFVEKDKFCQKVLNKNFKNIPIEEDIRNVKGSNYTADIVSGGFPCQPFSVAGKRKGKDDDRYLWDETIRVVAETKPKWFVGENVEGIINISNGTVLQQIQQDLEKEGFQVQCLVIPASGVGAWHQRKRVWIIGCNVSNSNSNRNTNEIERSNGEKEKVQREHRQEDSSAWKFIRTNSNDVPNTSSQRQFTRNNREMETKTKHKKGTRDQSSFQTLSSCSDVPNTNSGNWKQDVNEWRKQRVEQTKSGGFVLRKKNKPDMTFGAKLSDAMLYLEKKILPTPTARDYKDAAYQPNWKESRDKSLPREILKNNKPGGKLNPHFVEFLMAYPQDLDKDRTNRIKALGNSIVPLIAYEIGKAIISAEDQSD